MPLWIALPTLLGIGYFAAATFPWSLAAAPLVWGVWRTS
jgi:hypothetical protein